MRSHLIVFDPLQVDKNTFRDTIDGMKDVLNWSLFFGNTMCVASTLRARALSEKIRQALPGARFLVSSIEPTEKGGWLPKDIWEAINEPAAFDQSSDA